MAEQVNVSDSDAPTQPSGASRIPPAKRDEYSVFRPITTRWFDNDIYGHVNNIAYYGFFDTAVNGWLMDQGLLDPVSGDRVGLVVKTGCQYFAPIAFPDKVIVGLSTSRIGRSSVQYEIGVFRNEEPLASAQGFFVHVYVDRRSRRPQPLAEKLRRALEEIACVP